AMESVLNLAEKVARVNSTVLLQGESGVGKGVVARIIHDLSAREDGPFVAINCGAIPETLLESELFGYETGAFTGASRKGKPGLIETAEGGTLFLDEITEIPLNLQVKLLQVIQERRLVRIGGVRPIAVDIRVIAATNQDIEMLVREGLFREDLYYRLNVVPIKIPPLRERQEDIIPLINHFLERYNKKYGQEKDLTREAKRALKKYHWPGNCRELENLIERLVVTSEQAVIGLTDLPQNIKGYMPGNPVEVHRLLPLGEARELVEKLLLEKARAEAESGSTYEMARILSVDQSTVVRKWNKYFPDK
ncbi:MAG: sigma 54-interacting transcriptional regulator, partial [Halanaerobium sp.]|nr:sigma 54-interacting transcriptional regulator [Halanaerobium sp.]